MYDRIITLLRREAESHELQLLNGSAPDFVHYRAIVAASKAYRHAMEIVDQARRMDEGDEED